MYLIVYYCMYGILYCIPSSYPLSGDKQVIFPTSQYIKNAIQSVTTLTHPSMQESEMYPTISNNVISAWLQKITEVITAIFQVSVGVQRVFDLP